MEHLTPPKQLDITENKAENWRKYKQVWNIYSLASGLNKKNEAIQVATFLHVIGSEAVEVYNNFTWAEATDKDKINEVLAKFDKVAFNLEKI